MSMSKAQAMKDLERAKLSNQQALVDKINGTPTITKINRIIPAGKTLLDTVSREDLPRACYTWLRHCRHYTEFKISFLKSSVQSDLKKTKVMDFDSRSRNLEWESRGKKWLGEVVAENLLKSSVVAVSGDKDGLYIHTTEDQVDPASDNWEPYVEFTPFKGTR